MPNLIHYAIPAFILLMVIEVLFSAWQDAELYDFKDTVASLTMGIGNVIIKLFTKIPILGAYFLAYEFRFFDVPSDAWWAWVLLFFLEDFTYWLFHFSAHNVRFFWAAHVTHHSSQKYNLSTALRQTWTGALNLSFVFWLWLPLLGFHPLMVMTMQSVSLIYQFWIHTEAVGKLGFLEWFWNTPSHHRVHHASDVKYLDRNHAGILIIWDRMFGTFIEEDECPIYGLTKNLNSFNPVKIAFHEWQAMLRDASQTGLSLWERLGYVFGPPGWSHNGSRKTTAQLRAEINQ